MGLSTGLMAAALTVSAAADGATGVERRDVKSEVSASEADDGKILKVAAGEEFLVALEGEIGSAGSWQILQFDLAVLQGIEQQEAQLEPRPDPQAVSFLSRETFRFRARRTGETGLAFAFFNPWERTPPEKQVRILVQTG